MINILTINANIASERLYTTIIAKMNTTYNNTSLVMRCVGEISSNIINYGCGHKIAKNPIVTRCKI